MLPAYVPSLQQLEQTSRPTSSTQSHPEKNQSSYLNLPSSKRLSYQSCATGWKLFVNYKAAKQLLLDGNWINRIAVAIGKSWYWQENWPSINISLHDCSDGTAFQGDHGNKYLSSLYTSQEHTEPPSQCCSAPMTD